jgi:aryl carrier-like protein
METSTLERLIWSAVSSLSGANAASFDHDTNLVDLGLDSVDIQSIVSQVESACALRFTPGQIIELVLSPSIRSWLVVIERAISASKT